MRTSLNGKSLSGQDALAAWMNYTRWNRAIAGAIFNEEAAGRPVFIDLEDETLTQVAATVGVESSEARPLLVDAVTTILNRPTHPEGVFARVMRRLAEWKAAGDASRPPPVVAVLAVLCLAAEDMAQGDGLSANNYYGRLMPLLGVTSESEKNKIIDAYRQVSREIWDALNEWLEDLQGERGLPTAYSYSHVHIGRPISQALIRSNDRKRLQHFFQAFGLAPHSRLSAYDMQALLNEWLRNPSSSAPKGLRNLWKGTGARERITEVAVGLLELWDGPSEESPTGQQATPRAGQLSLQALLRSFPSPGLEINVVGNGSYESGTVAHVLNPVQDAIPLSLEPVAGRRFRLADASQIETRSLIEGRFSLSSHDAKFERRPRRIVPLRRDHLLQAFLEAERLPLGEDSIVLAQEGLAEQVEEALSVVARPGFRRVDPLPSGCPECWALFSDVQILSALPPVNPKTGKKWHLDFNVLQPIGTTQLTVEGGLQLPGRMRQWSSLDPPEVRVTSDAAGGLVLSVEQIRTLGEMFERREWNFPEPVAVVALKECDIPDGDYLIEARKAGGGSETQTLIDQVRVRLRSGTHPVPTPTDPPPPHLGRPLDALAEGVFSARWIRGEQSNYFRGALAHGMVPPKRPLPAMKFLSPEWVGGKKSSSDELSASKVLIPAADVADCYVTGSHVIDLPTFDGKVTQDSIEGVCRNCGLTKRYPSRFRMKWKAEKAKGFPQAVMFDVTRVSHVASEGSVGPDAAFDALTFLGSGSGTSLEQLSLQIEPSRLFADRYLRALEVLGHVEVSRDAKTFIVKEWELAPPYLAELCSGSYSLTGTRSKAMSELIGSLAHKLDLGFEQQVQTAAPSLIELSGEGTKIQELTLKLTEELGTKVEIMPEAAANVAATLPPLSEAISCLPKQSVPAFRSAQRWNSTTVGWETVSDASAPGAYRLQGAGIVYCVRTADDVSAGTMMRGDARLVKHVDALGARTPLVAYLPDQRILLTPLGADLPLLYGRAAVMATGRLPVENLDKRVLLYADVPEPTAARIISALTN